MCRIKHFYIMKKNILYISPAFSGKGVAYKHNLLFLEAINATQNIHLATGKKDYNIAIDYTPVLSTELPLDLLNSLVNRLFPNRVFYGSDPFKQPRIPFLKRRCEDHIQANNIDIIHTVCRPYYAHRIGYELKQKYGLPWIAQFLDAWIDNPDRIIPSRLKKSDAEMEALVAKNADVILHTNRQLADIWQARYGDIVKNKMYIMPFCYNKQQIEEHDISVDTNVRRDKKIIFSYIGISVGNRNLQDIIEATKKAVDLRPSLHDRMQINVMGNMLPIDASLIKKYELNDIIVHKGYLRGQELQDTYLNTDVFIAIDSPMEINVFFPSKLLDYFYYQKPILGITSRHGVTNDLLIKAGHTSIENGDIDGLVSFINRATDKYEDLLQFDKDFYLSFSPETVETLYSNIIDNF